MIPLKFSFFCYNFFLLSSITNKEQLLVKTSAKPVSPRTQVLYINQSINQWIKQKVPSHSINQSIYPSLLIALDRTNQAINFSVPWKVYVTKFIPMCTLSDGM